MSCSYSDRYNTCDNNDCRARIFGNQYRISREDAERDQGLTLKGSLVSVHAELCASCYEAHQRRMQCRRV